MSAHAVKSPSSASRWAVCTASILECEKHPVREDDSSPASRMGTCGHQILEDSLTAYVNGSRDIYTEPQLAYGYTMGFKGRESFWMEHPFESDLRPVDHTHTVDDALASAVQSAYDFVIELHRNLGGTLYPEMRVPVDHITGEAGAQGTADAVIWSPVTETLVVADLKLGMREVSATWDEFAAGVPNPQLVMYASGVAHKLGVTPKNVRLIILQPFVGSGVGEWTGDWGDVHGTCGMLSHRAKLCDSNPRYAPDEKTCQWCPASGRCEAQSVSVFNAAVEGFEEVLPATLGDKLAAIPLVELWCKAVKKAARDDLKSGRQVVKSDGETFKLVSGKAGHRKWLDESHVGDTLTLFFDEQVVYKRSLLSPADLEKLVKPKGAKKGEPALASVGNEVWQSLQDLITQGCGEPQIVPSSDPREAIENTLDGFDEVNDD